MSFSFEKLRSPDATVTGIVSRIRVAMYTLGYVNKFAGMSKLYNVQH